MIAITTTISPVPRCISFAGRSHLFVVMGVEQEFMEFSHPADLVAQLGELLPPQIRLLTFDELLRQYEAGLYRHSFVLMSVAGFCGHSGSESPDGFLPQGCVIKRRALHERFGGFRNLGISVSSSPDVFLHRACV